MEETNFDIRNNRIGEKRFEINLDTLFRRFTLFLNKY